MWRNTSRPRIEFSRQCRRTTPLSTNYRPEIETTQELHEVDETDAAFAPIVELGAADICLEVSLLSHHLDQGKKRHMAPGTPTILSIRITRRRICVYGSKSNTIIYGNNCWTIEGGSSFIQQQPLAQ